MRLKVQKKKFINFLKKENLQIKSILILCFVLLGILTLCGAFGWLGKIGKALAYMQFWILGYLGYFWLFGLAFWLKKSKSIPTLKTLLLEKILGFILGLVAFLVFQALFFKGAGIIGVAFNEVLQPIITPLGIFVLVLAMAVMAIVLYSGKTLDELVKVLFKDLKKDAQSLQIETQKIRQNSQKNWLKIKLFFTPPSKTTQSTKEKKASLNENSNQESHLEKSQELGILDVSSQANSQTAPHQTNIAQDIPRPMTLEELIAQSPAIEEGEQKSSFQGFSFEEEEEEEYLEAQKEGFNADIDEVRQGVELPTWEEMPLMSNNTQETIQIRKISPQEVSDTPYNLEQFQKDSLANLEKFKRFEQDLFLPKEEPEEKGGIRLIKAEESQEQGIPEIPEIMYQTQETKNSTQNTLQEENLEAIKLQNLSSKQDSKPLIKAYPKKLYAATPFSAYYEDKEEYPRNKPKQIDDAQVSDTQESEIQEIQEALGGKIQEIQEILQESEVEDIRKAVSNELLEAELFLKQSTTSPLSEQEEETYEENFLQTNQEGSNKQEIPQKNTFEPKQAFREIQESLLGTQNPNHTSLYSFGNIQQEKIQEIYTQVATNSLYTHPLDSDYSIFKAQEIFKNTSLENSPLKDNQENPISKKQEDWSQTLSQDTQETNECEEVEGEIEEIVPFNSPQSILKNSQSNLSTPTHLQDSQTDEELDIQNLNVQSLVDSALLNLSEDSKNSQEIPQAQTLQTQIPQEFNTLPLERESPKNLHGFNPQEVQEDLTPKAFILPSLEFLQQSPQEQVEIDEGDIDRKINDLLSKLRMFKIEGDIVSTYSGPIVTTFEFRPSPNVKVSRILTLQDDLAMALRAKTIRIQAPVPGKDVVGIEIPNNHIETIYLREILEHNLFQNSSSPLTLALGKDIMGNPFVTDLKKLPHLLIAGTTGSGKSVGINAMILSLLYKNTPDELKLIMIDPKMLEFSMYNDIPHLLTPVITQPKKAIIALDNAVKEMERRYSLMSEARIKNIEGYNQKAKIDGFEPFPYIVIIIDELADLMMSGGKEAEVSISRLAQMARASGIHLIVATQRPSVDVVTGLIKANLPSRISYKVGQKIDSKVILDTFGAESLLGRGDMLFTPPGGGIVRLHAPWSSEVEIEKIVEFIKSQRSPQYDENFMPNEDEIAGLHYEGEVDELYEEAKRIVLSDNKTSISYIQRRLGIGYNKAANIVEQMQVRGFLSEPNSKGVREILNKE